MFEGVVFEPDNNPIIANYATVGNIHTEEPEPKPDTKIIVWDHTTHLCVAYCDDIPVRRQMSRTIACQQGRLLSEAALGCGKSQ
jgi:hypothetical protein